jgi:hypothetical protein
MRRSSSTTRLFYVAVTAWMALYCIDPIQAQVESIEPNPTQPFDIDTDFGYGPTNGGARFGRGPARPGQPREENPAETLLRGIEGTNYGRYTGHPLGATIRGGQPENRWRYHFHRGRWWYWTPAGRWEFFDGRRWLRYSAR